MTIEQVGSALELTARRMTAWHRALWRWATGRLYVEHHTRGLRESLGMARGLLDLVGVARADRAAFAPVRGALSRTIMAHRLRVGYLSPWAVLVFLPPCAIGFGGNRRADALLYALLVTCLAVVMRSAVSYRVLGARVAAAMAAGLCCLCWFNVVHTRPLWLAPEPFAGIGRVAFVVFVCVELPLLVVRFAHLRRQVDRAGHPCDELVARIVETADLLYRERAQWNSSRIARGWQAALEVLAVDAAAILSLSVRTDRADIALRRQLRGEGARIGEGIRMLKRDLAHAGGESDVVAVVEKLTRGMLQVARHDRAALLAVAPAQVATSSLPVRLLTRLLPAGVFFGAALCVRWVPPIAHTPHLLQTVQWSLLVSGAAMLVSANSEVRSRVQDVVGKALTS